MISMILAFIVVFGLFYFGLNAVITLTQKEAWSLTKYMLYCTLCTALALSALILIVILF